MPRTPRQGITSRPSRGTAPHPMPSRWTTLVSLTPRLTAAAAFRFVCYAAMTGLALVNERRWAPTLPDVLVNAAPFVPWVSRLNYLAWLFLYLPLAVALLVGRPETLDSLHGHGAESLSLARGACIVLTGLGPPDVRHAGHGPATRAFSSAYYDLLSPLGVFSRGAAHAYLTKDLFFSGHTATTFLLLLYLWERPVLRYIAMAAHVVVVTTVVFAHLHYLHRHCRRVGNHVCDLRTARMGSSARLSCALTSTPRRRAMPVSSSSHTMNTRRPPSYRRPSAAMGTHSVERRKRNGAHPTAGIPSRRWPTSTTRPCANF